MIQERADKAIKFPATAPSTIESILTGGLTSEDDDERIEATAAVHWMVYEVKRIEALLTGLCKAWDVKVKDP